MYARIDEVYLVFIALVFGGLGVGQAGSIAPNYTKAKASAARIISLLDREPVIDNFSEAGSTPVSHVYAALSSSPGFPPHLVQS